MIQMPRSQYVYPGGYVPAPISRNEVLAALEEENIKGCLPLVNLAETPEAFCIEISAPGLKRDDFHISVHEKMISITALHRELEDPNKIYHKREFNNRCFTREFALPENVDPDFLSAEYKSGILYVVLPKCYANITGEIDRIVVY